MQITKINWYEQHYCHFIEFIITCDAKIKKNSTSTAQNFLHYNSIIYIWKDMKSVYCVI